MRHKESIKTIINDVAIFDKWATEESKSAETRSIKLLYASERLDNILLLLKERIKYKRYWSISEDLWYGSHIDIPCNLYKQYPSAVADAFIIPTINKKGHTKKYDKLTNILNKPIKCPAKELHSNHETINPTLKSYANILDHTNGKDLKKWFIDNKKEIVENKKTFNQINKSDTREEINKIPSQNDILMQAVLKHIFYKKENKIEIPKLLKSARNYDQLENTTTTKIPKIYDGSDQSMIDQLDFYKKDWRKSNSKFNIPCTALIKKPIFANTSDIYSKNDIRNFLNRHNCDLNTYDLPNTVKRYISLVEGLHLETIHRGARKQKYHRLNNFYGAQLSIQLFPRKLALSLIDVKDRAPYETWSYLNLNNRKYYEDLKLNYSLAQKDLYEHYINTFNLNKDMALIASKKAMWAIVNEGYSGEPPTSGLRYKILEEENKNDLISYIKSSDDLALLEQSKLVIRNYSGDWPVGLDPDPLIMLTINKPEILKLLISKKNSYNSDKVITIDTTTQNNPNTAINARNSINKTALHTAVQENNLASVKILIEAGADTSLIVSGSLTHNERTVGMYAANNADIEVIKYLKENGISYDGNDSQGVGTIGYLMGFGELDANPYINEYNFEDFIYALNPEIFTPKASRLSPSFNCKNAKRYSEITICENTHLALLDRYLSKKYSRVRKDHKDIKELKETQIAWIKESRNCKNVDCLVKSYQKRILEISELSSIN